MLYASLTKRPRRSQAPFIVFTSQPQPATTAAGTTAHFSATAQVSNGRTPEYQWQVSTNSGAAWLDVSGETGQQIAVSDLLSSQNGNLYRVVASSLGAGSVASSIALLTVQTIAISQQPTNQTAVEGEAAFSVSASVSPVGSPSYQWQKSIDSGSTWQNVAGETASAIALSGLDSDNNDEQYRVVVSAGGGSVISSAATLSAATVTITQQPTNQTTSEGEATFEVSATVSPSGTPSYQWQRSTDGGATWSVVSGETSSSISLSGQTAGGNNRDRYRAVISFAGAVSVASNAVMLTVPLFAFTNPTPSFSGSYTSLAYSNGPSHGRGDYAFSGGVLAPNGKVVLVPWHSTVIGLYDTASNTYTNGPSHGHSLNNMVPGLGHYSGGVLTPDGRVIFAPGRNGTIGIYDPYENTFNTIAASLALYAAGAGVVTSAGKVVFAPSIFSAIGLYSLSTGAFSKVDWTPSELDGGFSGCVLLPNSEQAVFVPGDQRQIVVYDASDDTYAEVAASGPRFANGAAPGFSWKGDENGSNFAFSGGVLAPDGKVIFVPFTSGVVGVFDPVAGTYSDGPAHGRGVNRPFAGGVLMPNGRIALVPYRSSVAGVYNPAQNTYSDGPSHGKPEYAFRGGVLAPSGEVILIPFMSNTIGILTPNPLLTKSLETVMSPYLNKF